MELRTIVERISASPEVRVIILSSALEKYFTAGLDRASLPHSSLSYADYSSQ